MVETRKTRQLKFRGVSYDSYKSLIKLNSHLFKPVRWSSTTLFPVKFIGIPYSDSSGELVVLVRYLGYSKKYDEVKPVRDLVPFTGKFNIFLMCTPQTQLADGPILRN